MNDPETLLQVKGLKTHFLLDEGTVKAVDGVDFEVHRNRTLCIVGESGCGKSATAHSILQIVPKPGRVVEGKILFHREASTNDNGTEKEIIDLAALNPKGRQIREVRGKEIAIIFQEPMTSLSPIHTIGNQMIEAIRIHLPLSAAEARERSIGLLQRVGIPRPAELIDAYTFQLSGGMRQRAMIAIALACEPALLIADEPTTALDVTTQAQILDLLLELQEAYGMGLIFITHDLGVVAEIADEVVVMYLGQVVEQADVDTIFAAPKHPYTKALIRAIPRLQFTNRERLYTIQGMVPRPYQRPTGCSFHPRCVEAVAGLCDRVTPPKVLLSNAREVRCHLYDSQQGNEGQRTELLEETI